MKTETKTTYVFEYGDIIVHASYFWVAIRTPDLGQESPWKHTNLDVPSMSNRFTDEEVAEKLESGQWAFLTTHVRAR